MALMYRVGIISDSHIQPAYLEETALYNKALSYLKNDSACDKLVGVGDILNFFTMSETSTALTSFLDLAWDAGWIPGETFITTMGNHENNGSGTTPEERIAQFAKKIRANNRGYSYPEYGKNHYREWNGDYWYIVNYRKFSASSATAFIQSDMDEFKEFFDTHNVAGKRVFVLQHAIPAYVEGTSIQETISGHVGVYADRSNWQWDDTSKAFFNAIEYGRSKGAKVIWLHGHSHFSAALENPESLVENERNANIDTIWADASIHIPSCGQLADKSHTRIEPRQSEVAVMDVYEDRFYISYFHADSVDGTYSIVKTYEIPLGTPTETVYVYDSLGNEVPVEDVYDSSGSHVSELYDSSGNKIWPV